MTQRFRDRVEAGQLLAQRLMSYANQAEVLVLGLPRGGVPVAFQVAKALQVPMDICLVHKLGVPGHKELAMGAIAARGVRVLNYDVLSWLGISSKTVDQVAERELRELQRRDRAYRNGHEATSDTGPASFPTVRDRIILLVDDGIATGSTIRAAIAVLRQEQPQKIVVAVPVAPVDVCKSLSTEVEEIVCVRKPEPFYAIGLWYEDFSQTTDEEVRQLLNTPTVTPSSSQPSSSQPSSSQPSSSQPPSTPQRPTMAGRS